MAKVVKSTREVVDINEEMEKIEKKKKNGKKESDPKKNKEEKVAKNKDKKKKDGKDKKDKKIKKKNPVVTFFGEVKKEVSKVKWPSRKDMVKYSIATISFIVFFALFFFIIDMIMAILLGV